MRIKYFLIILLIILFGYVFVWQGIYLPRESGFVQPVTFLVEKGEGAKEIAANLKERGLIRWGSLFRFYVLIKGVSGNLKSGEYSLSKSMNIPKMTEKFVSGEVIKKKITIVEGWNLRDIGWYFENKGMFMAEELFELVGFPAADYGKATDFSMPKDFSDDYDFLKDLSPDQYIGSGGKSKNVGLEGYLFPDTYEINKEANLEEIVRKMLNNFDKKLTPELREEISSQGKTIFEIITMASLIEKEVKIKEDKEIVSGILWKRLKNNIPLQVDATITYITGKKTTDISKEETQINSPYNTYKYRGLPLGPICNPGLESILTALRPKDSDYLYYLSAADGKTIFSRTLEEHNIAKQKYLK